MRREGYSLEVIVTGDEILFGRILDSNSNWIARRAAELGAHLRRITTVGDEVDDIASVLRDALTRGNDLIIFTGGLGPSEDDLTVEAIAGAVCRSIVIDQGAFEKIKRSYERRGFTNIERGMRMARIVEGSKALPNPVGLSAGMMLQVEDTVVVTFPGIPVEMKAMFDESVAPLIESRAQTRFTAKTMTARVVFGEFFPIYRAMQAEYPDVYIKNAATPPEEASERVKVREIKVDLVVEAPSVEECTARMDEVVADFMRRIEAKNGELVTR
jgi:molybdenum cofactor synthesis domain-containing protein